MGNGCLGRETLLVILLLPADAADTAPPPSPDGTVTAPTVVEGRMAEVIPPPADVAATAKGVGGREEEVGGAAAGRAVPGWGTVSTTRMRMQALGP